MSNSEKQISKEEINRLAEIRRVAILFAGEYCYRKFNPESPKDVPSMVYEDVEKSFDKWNKK